MPKPIHSVLSRRERQIMDVLYRRGRATVTEVMSELAGEPNSSTVRTPLRVLDQKGHVRHEEVGLRHVFIPVQPRHAVRQSALKHLIETFYEGSAEKVVTALLGSESGKLTDEQLDRIAEVIEKARKGPRR